MPTFFQSHCGYLSVVTSLFVVYNRNRRWTEDKHTDPSNKKYHEMDVLMGIYKAYLHSTSLLSRISSVLNIPTLEEGGSYKIKQET